MWKGVTALQPGAVLIGILLVRLTVFIRNQRLDKLGMVAIGYLIVAIISFFLHIKRGTCFKAEKDFEYV